MTIKTIIKNLYVPRQLRAAYLISFIQILLIIANVFLRLYGIGIFVFTTGLIYLIVYFNFLAACSSFFESGNKSRFIKIFRVLSPILFFLTFIFAVIM
ncbi:MAG: hypothetical protein ACYCYI_11385 [Saccharofermentanales bacterium]